MMQQISQARSHVLEQGVGVPGPMALKGRTGESLASAQQLERQRSLITEILPFVTIFEKYRRNSELVLEP